MTQEQFAAKAGISLKYQQRIEGGGENLTIKSLVKLATALHVGIGALFTVPSSSSRRGRPRSSRRSS
jgi:transcriptional regulator with XRE-family HTH domain